MHVLGLHIVLASRSLQLAMSDAAQQDQHSQDDSSDECCYVRALVEHAKVYALATHSSPSIVLAVIGTDRRSNKSMP